MKMQKLVAFVMKKIENKYAKGKKYCKVRDHCHYIGEIEVLHIAYVI